MENPRPEKVAVVEEVKSRLGDADAAVLTDYRGIDVPGMATLRTALREAGAEYAIYKNTLVRFAARDLGLEIEELKADYCRMRLPFRRSLEQPGGTATATPSSWPRPCGTSPRPTRTSRSRAVSSGTGR